MIKLITSLTGGALLAGCAFVQVSPAGSEVVQASVADVVHCKDVGEVVSQTRERMLLKRNEVRVKQELIDLARNQAAAIGANAIVPIGQPVQGSQRFRAYRCG